MLTNRDVNTFVHNILEKYAVCEYGTFMEAFISAHDTKMQGHLVDLEGQLFVNDNK
jgi:hypothetical protein